MTDETGSMNKHEVTQIVLGNCTLVKGGRTLTTVNDGKWRIFRDDMYLTTENKWVKGMNDTEQSRIRKFKTMEEAQEFAKVLTIG